MLTTKKEKMNTEEEVNKAASEYAESSYGFSKPNAIEDFKAGAKWQQSQSAVVAEKKGDKDEEIKRLKEALEQLGKAVTEYMPNVDTQNEKQMKLYTVYHTTKQALNPKG